MADDTTRLRLLRVCLSRGVLVAASLFKAGRVIGTREVVKLSALPPQRADRVLRVTAHVVRVAAAHRLLFHHAEARRGHVRLVGSYGGLLLVLRGVHERVTQVGRIHVVLFASQPDFGLFH